MRSIISWNVNGIRAIEKKGFIDWLLKESPDVICLQETKAHPGQLSLDLQEPSGYFAFYSSAKKAGYSGTAIFSKKQPDEVTNFNITEFDDEGRVIIAKFGRVYVISAYFPNSQEAGKRLDYKLAFCEKMLQYCNDRVSEGNHIILCGDYNIAHKPIDLANPKTNEGNPGYLPEERDFMTRFLEAGYIDCFRKFCAEGEKYTWWSYRFKAREKNIGWRIDYTCVNKGFENNVKSASILSDVMGSDHCPIKLVVEV